MVIKKNQTAFWTKILKARRVERHKLNIHLFLSPLQCVKYCLNEKKEMKNKVIQCDELEVLHTFIKSCINYTVLAVVKPAFIEFIFLDPSYLSISFQLYISSESKMGWYHWGILKQMHWACAKMKEACFLLKETNVFF